LSNVSLAGGLSVDLTGATGALAGRSDAAAISATIQSAIGKIETILTGASSGGTPVRITDVQQIAPTNLTVTNGSVTLDQATLGLAADPGSNTMVVVALPANLPSGTNVFIPASIETPVVVISGTGDVNIYALGTGGQNTVIIGNVGNNIIYGDSGDTLSGGDGNDTVGALLGNASVEGGAGNDLIFGASGNDTLLGGTGDDVLVGSVLGLTSGTDSLSGGDGNDYVISGASGAAVMSGDLGNDSMVGGTGADSIDGGAGNDHILAGAGADTLIGGAGTDNLQGGAGNDSLSGGDGNDTLWGGSGADTLTGGAGADIFYVSGAGAGSSVRISDFSSADSDQVDLVGITQLVVGGSTLAVGTTASVAVSSGNTIITLPDGSTITLVGIATLPANSIIFGS